jgi:hypothetical protein
VPWQRTRKCHMKTVFIDPVRVAARSEWLGWVGHLSVATRRFVIPTLCIAVTANPHSPSLYLDSS